MKLCSLDRFAGAGIEGQAASLLAGRDTPVPAFAPPFYGGRPFAGSEMGRLLDDWMINTLSPDDEMRTALRAMRARTRDLVRNNPTAQHHQRLIDQNAIGPHGMEIMPAFVLNDDKTPDEDFNKLIKSEWEDFEGVCMVDRSMDLHRCAGMALRTAAMDGENFTRKHRGFKGNRFNFGLQFIDADLVNENLSQPRRNGKNEIRMGVEVDQWGGPLNYYVWDAPYSLTSSPSKVYGIPADEMIHLFMGQRPNQARGITWFSSSMVSMQIHGAYCMAELVAARFGAATVMTYTNKGEGLGLNLPGTTAGNSTVKGQIIRDIAPGTIGVDPMGWESRMLTPAHPNKDFPAFVKAVLREIAVGLGLSYYSLTGDHDSASYSATRTAKIDERDYYGFLQAWMKSRFYRPIFRGWLEMQWLNGNIDLRGRSIDQCMRCVSFQGRGWDWIDPLKEVQAALLAIAGGLSSRTEEHASRGGSFKKTAGYLRDEDAIIADYKLILGGKANVTLSTLDAAQGGDMESNDNAPAKGKGASPHAVREQVRKVLEADDREAVLLPAMRTTLEHFLKNGHRAA